MNFQIAINSRKKKENQFMGVNLIDRNQHLRFHTPSRALTLLRIENLTSYQKQPSAITQIRLFIKLCDRAYAYLNNWKL